MLPDGPHATPKSQPQRLRAIATLVSRYILQLLRTGHPELTSRPSRNLYLPGLAVFAGWQAVPSLVHFGCLAQEGEQGTLRIGGVTVQCTGSHVDSLQRTRASQVTALALSGLESNTSSRRSIAGLQTLATTLLHLLWRQGQVKLSVPTVLSSGLVLQRRKGQRQRHSTASQTPAPQVEECVCCLQYHIWCSSPFLLPCEELGCMTAPILTQDYFQGRGIVF